MDREKVKKSIIEEAKEWIDSSQRRWVFWDLGDLAYRLEIYSIQAGDLEKLTREDY